MTQILIQGETILAIHVVEQGDVISAPDIIYPKSVLSDWSIVEVDLPADFQLGAYKWEAGSLVPLPPPAGPALSRQITVLAMRNRFTKAEKIHIDLASIDDPAKSLAERQQAAEIRVLQADLAASSYVDLDREDTRDGVLQLELAGILPPGRALEILDAPVELSERPIK
ncbi:hypothetical protein [Massilia endophytica]|uniref:hypothetical protein n=1 Tax=Massilia endophytica TaxID=2899220 RepID=UPI001E29C3FC|nr:hypothetical protein [Massilia endophytica]UGQ45075.1 hypothetical protein LSQ66_14875 [Massilia endophytica]